MFYILLYAYTHKYTPALHSNYMGSNWWKSCIFSHRLQRGFYTKRHFFHDGESSWWVKNSIAKAESDLNNMGDGALDAVLSERM